MKRLSVTFKAAQSGFEPGSNSPKLNIGVKG